MGKKPVSKLIQVSNLKILKHSVLMKNDTSGTKVEELDKITILEFKDNGVILSMPPACCGEKHNLSLCFILLPLQKVISSFEDARKLNGSFDVTAKVTNIDRPKIKEENWTITLSFLQFDNKNWKEILFLYVEQQETINDLKRKNA